MTFRITGGGSSQPYVPTWNYPTQSQGQSPVTKAVTKAVTKLANTTWGNDPYATNKSTQTKPAKPAVTASGTKPVTPIKPAYHGAAMNNGGLDTTNAGQPSGPVHSTQPSPSQVIPYHPQSTWNPTPPATPVVNHSTGTGYVAPPANTSVTPPTGNSGGNTKPPTNTNVPPTGNSVAGAAAAAGAAAGSALGGSGGSSGSGSVAGAVGQGLQSTGTSNTGTGNAMAGNGNSGSNGVGLVNTDNSGLGGNAGAGNLAGLGSAALGAINGQNDQTAQWQTMAQQQAAASYIQQETAWQTYVNQLMSQMGLTDKGYQDQLNNSLNTLNDRSFQDYLQGRQDMADRGLAASGLASAQNTQLALAQQQQIGQLQQQMNQQKYANDTNYGQQMNQIQSQMDTLDPQALYNQYYQTIQQSGQQAAQQQFNDYMAMIKDYGPYLAPTADQYGQLANTAQNNFNNYQLGSVKNAIDQFTAQADANYKAGQLGVAQGDLALKASDTAVQEQQKWAQIANTQTQLDNQAAHWASQDANSARSTTALQITKAMDNLTSQMSSALTNGQTSQYNDLYQKWQGLQQSLQNVTMGAVSGGN